MFDELAGKDGLISKQELRAVLEEMQDEHDLVQLMSEGIKYEAKRDLKKLRKIESTLQETSGENID